MISKHRRLRVTVAAAFAAVVGLGAATPVTAASEPVSARTAVAGVRDIDWRDATLPLPRVGSCSARTVDFTDGAARTEDAVYRLTPHREVVYADVTGEGVEDALVFVDCGPPASEYSTALVAMTTDAQGDPRTLGAVVNTRTWTVQPTDAVVWYGDIAVAITDLETDQVSTRYYRYAASAEAFVRIDGR